MVFVLDLTSAWLAVVGLWAAVPDWPRLVWAAMRDWGRLGRLRGKPRVKVSFIGLTPGPPRAPKGWEGMASLPGRSDDLLAFTREMAHHVDWLTREAGRLGIEVTSLHHNDEAHAQQAQVRARQREWQGVRVSALALPAATLAVILAGVAPLGEGAPWWGWVLLVLAVLVAVPTVAISVRERRRAASADEGSL